MHTHVSKIDSATVDQVRAGIRLSRARLAVTVSSCESILGVLVRMARPIIGITSMNGTAATVLRDGVAEIGGLLRLSRHEGVSLIDAAETADGLVTVVGLRRTPAGFEPLIHTVPGRDLRVTGQGGLSLLTGIERCGSVNEALGRIDLCSTIVREVLADFSHALADLSDLHEDEEDWFVGDHCAERFLTRPAMTPEATGQGSRENGRSLRLAA